MVQGIRYSSVAYVLPFVKKEFHFLFFDLILIS